MPTIPLNETPGLWRRIDLSPPDLENPLWKPVNTDTREYCQPFGTSKVFDELSYPGLWKPLPVTEPAPPASGLWRRLFPFNFTGLK